MYFMTVVDILYTEYGEMYMYEDKASMATSVVGSKTGSTGEIVTGREKKYK